jgi:GlcNAc-P-P-Und epimerase
MQSVPLQIQLQKPLKQPPNQRLKENQWIKLSDSGDPRSRNLIIVRPTVIFGEANHGNVYNLLKQIASGKFIMFGDGKNRKSSVLNKGD